MTSARSTSFSGCPGAAPPEFTATAKAAIAAPINPVFPNLIAAIGHASRPLTQTLLLKSSDGQWPNASGVAGHDGVNLCIRSPPAAEEEFAWAQTARIHHRIAGTFFQVLAS